MNIRRVFNLPVELEIWQACIFRDWRNSSLIEGILLIPTTDLAFTGMCWNVSGCVNSK